MSQLRALFEPIKIGNVEIKNRIALLPMGTSYVEAGFVTPKQTGFIVERAKGETGLIILGGVSPLQINLGPILSIHHDRYIPGLKQLTDEVHAYDSKIFCQFTYTYLFAKEEGAPIEIVGPSDHLCRILNAPARALTQEEIRQIIEEGGDAARRAREAGFDGVELLMGMGYVLCRFVSTHTNKRTDEYGGSPENRLRIVLEMIDNMKAKAGIGPDFPLICRISPEEFMEGGLTVEDWRVLAPMLEKAGVLGLNIEAGWHECSVPTTQMIVPKGAFVHIAHEMKKVVDIPVIAGHKISDPVLANQIIEEGKADLAGMGRPLIADPYLPRKAREGRLDEIRHCISCNECLDGLMWGQEHAPLRCTVNPQVGHETEDAGPAPKPKKIVVVGGGPAGMEAAIVAAQRGHNVVLFERQDRLGGQLIPAASSPWKDDINTLTKYLSHMMDKEGVEVRLSVAANAEIIDVEKPDAVVLAMGAVPAILDIPGVAKPNVVTSVDVLRGLKETGKKVVVIGGGFVGCELSLFLRERGNEVTLLEVRKRIGADIGPTTRWVVRKELKNAQIQMETEIYADEITDDGVRAHKNGETKFFEADTVVLAVGMKANAGFAEELKGKPYAVHTIGDCVEARKIRHAISEGFEIGRQL